VLSSAGWILCGDRSARIPALGFSIGVIGMNSIAIYCMAHLWEGFIRNSLKTHFGQNVFKFAGDTFEPFWTGAAVLLVLWLILFWMHRRKLYLRV